jgi:integrase
MSESDRMVVPNIAETAYGWRMFLRCNGKLTTKRFNRTKYTYAQVKAYVAGARADAERDRREHDRARQQAVAEEGTFARDARKYLGLKTVQAMPSYVDRIREIGRWTAVFGTRPRGTITARQMDEQLQAWRDEGAAPSSLNKYRTALMSLYTRLDGRAAANPVRETRSFEEPAAQPRGLSYDLIKRLLDLIPREQSAPIAGVKGSRSRGNKTRARLEIMAWTGMTPAQIRLLRSEHLNLRERWYVSPQRKKGTRRRRHPRPVQPKPMTQDAHDAFARFVALKAWGAFNTDSLRHTLSRAATKLEAELRTELDDPAYRLPRLKPYDLRHSFATELFRQTSNLPLVAEMLDHSSLEMTKRYAAGAMSDVMKSAMRQFETATTRHRKAG